MKLENKYIQAKNERFGNQKLLFTVAIKLHLLLGLLCNEQEVKIVHYVETDLMECQKNLKRPENKENKIHLVLKSGHG